MSTFSELISPNCIKVGESRGRSSLFSKFVLASTLLYFEIRATYRRLGSKMEAKFRTFSPPVKFCGGIGEMLECIFRARLRIQPYQ